MNVYTVKLSVVEPHDGNYRTLLLYEGSSAAEALSVWKGWHRPDDAEPGMRFWLDLTQEMHVECEKVRDPTNLRLTETRHP